MKRCNGSIAKNAAMIVEDNAGGHILVGPVRMYDADRMFMVIVGGVEPKMIGIHCAKAADYDEACAWRGELMARVLERYIGAGGIVLHDCGEERQFIELAITCYPGPKLETIRARIIGGGTA